MNYTTGTITASQPQNVRLSPSDAHQIPPDGCVSAKMEEIHKLLTLLSERLDVVLRPALLSACSPPSGPGPSHVWGQVCQIEGRISDILGRLEL